MAINCQNTLSNTPFSLSSSSSSSSSSFRPSLFLATTRISSHGRTPKGIKISVARGGGRIICGLLPVDSWASTIDFQSLLFGFSLLPYLGFLYFISKVESAPKLTLFGFYFLLVFVGATIPIGIYEKVQNGTSLSNVDWLHGGAESLLALSNLFVVLGLREALRKSRD